MDWDTRHLVNFFAVCGVDSLAAIGSDGGGKSPVERSYQPCVLCHFPKERRGSAFNSDAAVRLSLPYARFLPTRRQSSARPAFHSFLITDEAGIRTYGVSLLFYQRVTDGKLLDELARLQADYEANTGCTRVWSRDEPLLVSKTLLLILSGPYISFGQQVLEQLLTLATQDGNEHIVSQHLHCLLHKVFLPEPGRMVEYQGYFGSIFCRVGTEDGLPDIDFPFRLLIETFSVNDILCIFKCLLLESRFLLVSKDLHLIVAVAELLCVLLFPLYWDHVLAPITPVMQGGDIYDAPVPFIMGANIKCASPAREDLPFEISDEVSIVNIDFGYVDILERMDVPLPKASLLMANLKQKLEAHNVTSPQHARLLPTDRPITTSGLASVCENPDIFQHGMQVCCDLDMPIPSVIVHNRLVLKKGPSGPSLQREHSNSGSPKNTSPCGTRRPPPKTRLARIAQDAGISLNASPATCDSPSQDSADHFSEPSLTQLERLKANWAEFEEMYGKQQSFNRGVQQVFLDYFTSLLRDYSLYIFKSANDDILFDKVSFLSDQPDYLLGFFDLFLETHNFNRLIESKVSESYTQLPPALVFFDTCLEKTSSPDDVPRQPGSESLKARRRGVMSHTLRFEEFQQTQPPPVQSLEGHSGSNGLDDKPLESPGTGRKLTSSDTVDSPNGSAGGLPTSSHLSTLRQHAVEPSSPTSSAPKSRSTTPDFGEETNGASSPHPPDASVIMAMGMLSTPRPSDTSAPTATSQTTFVRRLLRDCRTKVKRLLVSKMGRDALLLGHADHTGASSEDNTLITSLCDVLERVWVHGNEHRKVSGNKGKSYMYTHLEAYYEQREQVLEDVNVALDDEVLVGPRHKVSTSDGDHVENSTLLMNGDSPRHSPGLSERSQMPRSHSSPSVGDLANNVKAFANNLRRDRSRSIGKLEARLMDEKVASHVRLLRACNTGPPAFCRTVSLLNDIRSVKGVEAIKTNIGFARAFIRLSLEKKSLSHHIAQLLDDKMMLQEAYRGYAFLRCDDELEQFLFHLLSLTTVDMYCFSTRYAKTVVQYSLIFLPGATSLRTTTKAGSVQIFGSHGVSDRIQLMEQMDSLSADVTNLGIIESIIIRAPGVPILSRYHRIFLICSVTDACYEMSFDNWLRSEDNCHEMLFVARKVAATVVLDANLSLRRASVGPTPNMPVVQSEDGVRLRENVASCVNRFAKYMDGVLPQSQHLTGLIWGEDGLCFHLHEVFAHGLKVSRVLRSKRPVWDFVEKVCNGQSDVPDLLATAFTTVDRKTNTSKSVKFYQLICCGLRCAALSLWMNYFLKSDQRHKMYQPWALILNPDLSFHVLAVVAWLCELNVQLPAAVENFIDK